MTNLPEASNDAGTGQMPAPEATGERLVPEAYAGQLVVAEHVSRYRLAGRLASGRRVLDAACGEGYGSQILAAAGASSVVGVDIDAAIVAHARERYGLDFRQADVLDLPFDAGGFDLVVSFETIEHVADGEAALSEYARVLAPRGVLIVSTPNPAEYLEENPYHLAEVPPGQLIAALRARFANVRRLYQQNFLASLIVDGAMLELSDPNANVDLEVRKLAGVPPGRELYAVALASNGELPALKADLATLSGVYEAHHLAEQLRQERALVCDWVSRAEQAERNQEAWEGRATEAERVQRAWHERASEAERQLEEVHLTLDRLTSSVSWRVTRPLRTLKERMR